MAAMKLPTGVWLLVLVGEWGDALPGDGLGQANRFPGGLADVRVVQQPVDGCGGQRFGHELVKACGVEVGTDRHGTLFVGGVDESVETFGGVGGRPRGARCRR